MKTVNWCKSRWIADTTADNSIKYRFPIKRSLRKLSDDAINFYNDFPFLIFNRMEQKSLNFRIWFFSIFHRFKSFLFFFFNKVGRNHKIKDFSAMINMENLLFI